MSKYMQAVAATILVLVSAFSLAGKPSANKAPTVSLTAPTNGATFSAPASITLSATASDTDGTIGKVEFYRGTTLIGTSTSAPYGITWSNVVAGTYSLTAKATDNGGATATSTAVSITVTGSSSGPNPITSPVNGAVVYGSTVNVSGTFTGDPTTTTVLVDNGNTTRLATLNNNNFTATLPLYAGANTLTASVVRRDKTSDTGSVTITGNDYPKIAWKAPATNVFTAPATIPVGVDALSPSGTIAKVEFYKNGTLQVSKTTPPFDATLNNVAAGNYTLAATATDNHGYTATVSRSVTVDGSNALPSAQLVEPTNGAVFPSPANIPLTATAVDSDGYIAQVEFLQNGAVLGATNVAPYNFNWTNIPTGTYVLTARATDNKGGITESAPVNVTVGTPNRPPTLTLTNPTAGTTFLAPATITLGVNATDTDSGIAKVEFYSGSTLIGTVTTAPYAFNWTNVPVGSYTLSAKATDNVGAVVVSASTTVNVILPNGSGMSSPDPELSAPAIDPTGPTTIAASTAFLYTGANPVQTGVLPGAIDLKRVAVLRGAVTNRSGQALPGVTITVNGSPELGQTTSRSAGKFDMAVNGGTNLTVNYAATGYLPVQRTVYVPALDYFRVPDVVMIPLDVQATAVNLTSMTDAAVARGSLMVDSAGSRQASVFVPQGTTATMTLPNGEQQVLPSITIRATEYTVGANGPNTMPGTLPAASGYTYAVENSIDEAVAAGAVSVNFNQPVYQYVDNYLNFPVGGIVPTGYYDWKKAAWLASDNGKVIKVLSVAGGSATLDVDGSGQAANSTQLAALNITNAERVKIASLFAAGASFWRIPMLHFSPWAHCWPFGPPSDAMPPTVRDPDDRRDMDKPACAKGSIIECQNQSLGESVPVAGTPFSLNYKSRRAPGAGTMSVNIPLTESTLPTGVKRVELEVSIMGRQFKQTFPAWPNQSFDFIWDGMDAYGRKVQGLQTAVIRIGYVYDGAYRTPLPGSLSFANFGGDTITGDRAAREITLWKQSLVNLGRSSAVSTGLGGWALDVHHFYDGSTLFLGDSSNRTGKEQGDVINTVTNGNGSIRSLAIDGRGNLYYVDTLGTNNGNAIYKITPDGTKTALPKNDNVSYTTVALDSQGNLIAWDYVNNVLHKITPDGLTTIIAGNGTVGFSGDGGPATQAAFSSRNGYAKAPGIVVDAQGNIFVADDGNHRIRKISPDGIVNTVAGNGTFGFAGDGGLAINASLGYLNGLAVDSEGNLFAAEAGNNRVRKISTDGIIRTIVGRGDMSGGVDGGLATSRGLVPYALAVDPQDTLYIAGASNGGIVWKVAKDGLIHRVAGVASSDVNFTPVLDDGALALRAGLGAVVGIALDTKGNIYTAQSALNKIRKISMAFPSLNSSSVMIASEDSQQVYEFDDKGRHKRALSAKTGADLYRFVYNETGYLTEVFDGDGNVTRVERDALDNPTAIVSPYGLRTTLTLDGNGYLASITNPALESTQMTYTDGGLMTTFTNPRSLTSTMVYNTDGRLIKDQNAEGGYWILDRIDLSRGSFQVAKTSALGRTTVYSVEKLSSGGTKNTTTKPGGSTEVTQNNLDGTRQTTAADGTVIATAQGPDPRFAMQAPIIKNATVTLPSGLTNTVARTRLATLSDASNPFSLVTESDTVTVNGKVFTTAYKADQREYTVTTPLNRKTITRTDVQGRPLSVQVTGIEPIHYTYDSLGRLATSSQGTLEKQRITSYSYNVEGYVASVTDTLDRVTSYTYDGAGRVRSVTLPDTRVIGFNYDANGNLTSVTPPGRPAHGFDYNGVDLATNYVPPVVGNQPATTRYEYNLDKQLTKVIRPDGQSIDYEYDAAGRLASQTSPTGTIGFTYKPGSGQLGSVTAPGGIGLTYGYDGMLLTNTTMTGPVSGSVNMVYDNFFRISQLGVNGSSMTFTYDDEGLLTGAGSLTLTRDAGNGFLTGSTLGQIATSYTYDEFGQLANFTARQGTAVLYEEQYARDKGARLTQKVVTISGQTSTYVYTYDAIGRLTDVTKDGLPAGHFEYDANGNRTLAYGLAAAYDDQDRLTSYAGAQYHYNANGELQQIVAGASVTNYVHDAHGNLTQVELPGGGKLDYLVDGHNRHIGKKVNGTLTQGFLYQDQLKPAAELDGQGNVVAQFVYAGKVNVPEYMVKGGSTYRIVTDELGSVRLVVDSATGQIAQRIDYDEWGNVLSDSNPGFQPFGYAGGLYDRDTGLVRFGARDYDPRTARWTAKDPILFKGGDTNIYAYVGGNPVNYTDSTGLIVDTIWDVGNLIYDIWNRNWCDAAADAVAMMIPGLPAGITKVKNIKGVHWPKQQHHIPGHPDFVPGKSELTANPEKLLDKAGTGTQLSPSKERVDFGEIIGTHVDPVTGARSATTNGIIHTGKNGSHIVPSRR